MIISSTRVSTRPPGVRVSSVMVAMIISSTRVSTRPPDVRVGEYSTAGCSCKLGDGYDGHIEYPVGTRVSTDRVWHFGKKGMVIIFFYIHSNMNQKLHVLTFATHSEGMYEDLGDDLKRNNLDLTVIGWGQKWIDYFNKLENVLSKIKELPSNDVVIIIDGFDTRMVPGYSGNDILTIYNSTFGGSGVVFSKETYPSLVPPLIGRYLFARVFGGDINAGMYIGRVEDMVPLLNATLQIQGCRRDDQCAFNKLTDQFKIRTDEDFKLFRNLKYRERERDITEFDTVFCGYPGTLSWSRVSRMPGEYGPTLWPELLGIAIFIYLIIIWRRNRVITSRLKG